MGLIKFKVFTKYKYSDIKTHYSDGLTLIQDINTLILFIVLWYFNTMIKIPHTNSKKFTRVSK